MVAVFLPSMVSASVLIGGVIAAAIVALASLWLKRTVRSQLARQCLLMLLFAIALSLTLSAKASTDVAFGPCVDSWLYRLFWAC